MLGLLRQYLGEQTEGTIYTAKELYAIIEVFAPLMTEEQEKELIEALKKL